MSKEKDLTQAQKEALERFKKTKDDPDTIAGMFYGLLKEADPLVIDAMERKAAVLMHAGYEVGRQISEAEKDPKKKVEMAQKLQTVAAKINSTVQKKKDEEKN